MCVCLCVWVCSAANYKNINTQIFKNQKLISVFLNTIKINTIMTFFKIKYKGVFIIFSSKCIENNKKINIYFY